MSELYIEDMPLTDYIEEAEKTAVEIQRLQKKYIAALEENISLKGVLAGAVGQLRRHRWCGDQFPENGWPGINLALARYGLYKPRKRRK